MPKFKNLLFSEGIKQLFTDFGLDLTERLMINKLWGVLDIKLY